MRFFSKMKSRLDLTRRRSIWLFSASVASPPLFINGCSTSPVTGKRILAGADETEEIEVDKKNASYAFSLHLGEVQDRDLNHYVEQIGEMIHRRSHRPRMPYNYRVVNANHINAFTFPAGSMALTRGLMVELQDESELAAVLGHEIAHVNARHFAQQQGRHVIAGIALTAIDIAAEDSKNRGMARILSRIGASAALATYSRKDEREADSFGQAYLYWTGYPADAMTAVHQMLARTAKSRPSVIDAMFSSHPMSSQRIEEAHDAAETYYRDGKGRPRYRDRYMDYTGRLRALRATIEDNANAETMMGQRKFAEAELVLRRALKRSPRDYSTNLRYAQLRHARGDLENALEFSKASQLMYPLEAQAHKLSGVLLMELGKPEAALLNFKSYEHFFDNDLGVTFLKGVAYESVGARNEAALSFRQFIASGGTGEGKAYAHERLRRLGSL
jgi:predicted Zn-dependent protease